MYIGAGRVLVFDILVIYILDFFGGVVKFVLSVLIASTLCI